MRIAVLLAPLLVSPLAAEPADLSTFKPSFGVTFRQAGDLLRVSWPMAQDEYGVLALRINAGAPLIEELGHAKAADGPSTPILSKVDPVTHVTVGTRDLSKQGWNAFFDNPPRRPSETFLAKLSIGKVRVESQGRKTTILLDGLSAGPFKGDLRFTLYAGCRLVHVEAVLSTDKDACAILYDAGITAREPSWKSVAWIDNQDKPQRRIVGAKEDASAVATRHRTIIAEAPGGSVAVFPPPHQFLYPLDFADNFGFNWQGIGYRGQADRWGLGVRQPPDGDKRFVPWVNAPPGTKQRLGVFYLLHAGKSGAALEEVRKFTRGDRYKPLEGYRTFTSHYHVEHTLDLLNRQRKQNTNGIPKELEEPGFVKGFKKHGVDIVHLAEFHVNHSPDFRRERIPQLQAMHAECNRLSNERFLLLPGEEPNVHLGGHWISLFPKPVHWILHPGKDEPFERKVEGVGTVYAVRDDADVLKLMERENGLMWTAHARTKSSYGFPDKQMDKPFFRSDRFLGAAWKAMPADYSKDRLGTRVLDLFNDMANAGHRKHVLGEVDVFKIEEGHELYGHMNINYLKLDKLPRFEDGWQPVLDSLRTGAFFVTTGEVLVPSFKVGGKEPGQVLKRGRGTVAVTARIEWTFPPAFAEVVLGDGKMVHRERIDLSEQAAFGSMELGRAVDLSNAKWLRFEVWDTACNGAFTEPVWIE